MFVYPLPLPPTPALWPTTLAYMGEKVDLGPQLWATWMKSHTLL